ncbi:MAG TPA: sulfurtransferase TusA family protein [Methylophilus sp.]|nr:sulfurtransferase TusA family protein [Methylophilus sp.]HQQ32668.1 sulfurtransferase TusA family protein [Methylophilus sp.]
MMNMHDMFIDLTGLESPVPVIRTKEALDDMQVGQVLKVTTTIESSAKNIRTLVANNPYEIIHFSRKKEEYTFMIRKNG